MKALQIGAGLVGRVLAEDLARDFDVTVLDASEEALSTVRRELPQVQTVCARATDRALLEPLVAGADVVTTGVPGRYGLEMLRTLIDLGGNVCDISFIPEDLDELQETATQRGLCIIPDIGVAPGMSNFLSGRGAALLDEVEDVEILVGGIPEKPEPPFGYKATWSPRDCIDEFLRPARYVEEHELVTVEAASGLHQRSFPIGTLEVFYTDGLRSIAKTLHGRNMREMTMRWPGHVEQMRLLRAMGLFDDRPRALGGVAVAPLDVAVDLLLPLWKMEPEKGDRDLTVMRVEVRGFKGRDEVTYTWDLCDRFDERSGRTSMSRCTGCSCAIFARALARGLVGRKGIVYPELLGGDDVLYNYVMDEHKARGVHYTETVKTVRNKRR